MSLTSRLDWLHNRVLTIASGLHEHIEYPMTISERLTYDSRDSPEPPRPPPSLCVERDGLTNKTQKVLIGKLTHAGFDDGPGLRVPEVIVIVG